MRAERAISPISLSGSLLNRDVVKMAGTGRLCGVCPWPKNLSNTRKGSLSERPLTLRTKAERFVRTDP